MKLKKAINRLGSGLIPLSIIPGQLCSAGEKVRVNSFFFTLNCKKGFMIAELNVLPLTKRFLKQIKGNISNFKCMCLSIESLMRFLIILCTYIQLLIMTFILSQTA